MDAVLDLMPDEERIQYSAMTGQSLFYLGETDLQHKILAIAEEEGVRQAAYALKLLQSDGELTIASTGKDEATGNLVTKQYRVKGPVMLMLTTTAIDVDEELLNRCLVLTINESREQTREIHARQRAKQTLAGLLAETDKQHITDLHRNAQRLLKPMQVVNPYANELTFMDDKTRTRRDHMKYLTLIRSIALLRQYQRPHKTVTHRGETLTYIEVTKDDIALANRIAHEVLGRTLDELPPQTRRLHVHDVDPDRGTVMIREGKGKRDRMIPIGERALAWIRKYLDEVRPQLALAEDEGTLFLALTGDALDPRSLGLLVADYIKRSGVNKTGSCHLFRHTMATLMLENGADVRFVQVMLGHAQLTSTQIYTQVAIRALKEIHTATHPARLERREEAERIEQPSSRDSNPSIDRVGDIHIHAVTKVRIAVPRKRPPRTSHKVIDLEVHEVRQPEQSRIRAGRRRLIRHAVGRLAVRVVHDERLQVGHARRVSTVHALDAGRRSLAPPHRLRSRTAHAHRLRLPKRLAHHLAGV